MSHNTPIFSSLFFGVILPLVLGGSIIAWITPADAANKAPRVLGADDDHEKVDKSNNV
jgi:hypothetical protein